MTVKFYQVLPLVLMVGVGISQVFLTQTQGLLVPDKGGGFGLFSTVDKLKNRKINVFFVDESGAEKKWKPVRSHVKYVELKRLMVSAKAFPSQKSLRRVVDKIKSMNIALQSKTIRLEVLKLAFESSSGKVKSVKVADFISR